MNESQETIEKIDNYLEKKEGLDTKDKFCLISIYSKQLLETLEVEGEEEPPEETEEVDEFEDFKEEEAEILEEPEIIAEPEEEMIPPATNHRQGIKKKLVKRPNIPVKGPSQGDIDKGAF